MLDSITTTGSLNWQTFPVNSSIIQEWSGNWYLNLNHQRQIHCTEVIHHYIHSCRGKKKKDKKLIVPLHPLCPPLING